MWPSREHVLQLGRTPSHLSFLLRQIIHASLLGFGTFALSVASRPMASAVGLQEPFCDGAFASIRSFSGGVAVLGDMIAGERCHQEAAGDGTLRQAGGAVERDGAPACSSLAGVRGV